MKFVLNHFRHTQYIEIFIDQIQRSNLGMLEKVKIFIEKNCVKYNNLRTELTVLPYPEQVRMQIEALHSGNKGVIGLPRKRAFLSKEVQYNDDNNAKKSAWINNIFYFLNSKKDPWDLVWRDKDNDCYVSANPLSKRTDKDGKIRRESKNCLGINELHLDIDVLHNVQPYNQQLADEVIRIVIAKLFDILPTPTIIVLSGRGLTWIYRYDHLLQDEEAKLHHMVFGKIIEKIQNLYAPEIVEIDPRITDAARVCRLAGTYNTKAERHALLHTCNPEKRYDPRDLYEMLGLGDIQIETAVARKKSVRKGQAVSKRKKIEKTSASKGIVFAPDWAKNAAKSWIPKMELIPEKVCLVDGSGRHNFSFLYYCLCRVLYTQPESEKKLRELNSHFQEPLNEEEISNIVYTTDTHTEDSIWKQHGDGTYIFGLQKLLKYLPLSLEQCREMGFLTSFEKRKKCKENQEKAMERDKIIARMWLEGEKATMIAKHIKGCGYANCSVYTVRRTIERLGIKEKKLSFEQIDWGKNKRYARKDKNGGKVSNFPITKRGEEREKEKARKEHEKAMNKLLTGEDCCLLGAAGTGKSTLLEKFIGFSRKSGKQVTVLAATGSAAEHIGGETIHHCLKIPVQENYDKVLSHERFALEHTDVLVMDEIGMIDANLFQHCIRVVEEAEFCFDRHIQIVLCGDFRQLAPVHSSGYAFFQRQYRIWNNLIVLHHVWRQEQKDFSDALEKIANGNPAGLEYIHTHAVIQTDFDKIREDLEQGAVYLGAYRKDVDAVNERMIQRHRKDDSFKEWKASDGTLLPTYVGMPVVFVKNTKQFVNGIRGIITGIKENSVAVQVGTNIIQVRKERIRDGEKTISQLPIRPAYAMTIHKGQGLTMSKVILNPKCFAPGQLYTALSRVRRIEDLVLTQKIRPQDVIASPEVIDFMKQVG